MSEAIEYPLATERDHCEAWSRHIGEVEGTVEMMVYAYRTNGSMDDIFASITRSYATNLVKLSKMACDIDAGIVLNKDIVLTEHVEVLRTVRDINLNVVTMVSLLGLTDALNNDPSGESKDIAKTLLGDAVNRLYKDGMNSRDVIESNYLNASQELGFDMKDTSVGLFKGIVNNALIEKYTIPMNVSVTHEINLFLSKIGINTMRDVI